MAKKNNSKKEQTVLRVKLLSSILEDEGRRVLFFLSLMLSLGIIIVLFLNLQYRPLHTGSFYEIDQAKESSKRLFVPIGFLMSILSLSIFSISNTYGKYTEATVGSRTIHPHSFFKNLSFYMILIGAAFLLSTAITDTITLYA